MDIAPMAVKLGGCGIILEKAPIKNVIKQKLSEGDQIDGARIEIGNPTVSIRIK